MKKTSITFIVTLISIIVLTSCKDNTSPDTNEKYEEVVIGNQVWMKKNLNLEKFRNGDLIKEAKTNEEWEIAGKNKQPAWCYFNNEIANGEIYGKLYNWYAINDPRGLAPKGWHIPTDDEWTELHQLLGTNSGEKMKSTSGWFNNGNGTNSSGFTALPGGFRLDNGIFSYLSYFGFWWTSTEKDASFSWFRNLHYNNNFLHRFSYYEKAYGFSVRCVKD